MPRPRVTMLKGTALSANESYNVSSPKMPFRLSTQQTPTFPQDPRSSICSSVKLLQPLPAHQAGFSFSPVQVVFHALQSSHTALMSDCQVHHMSIPPLGSGSSVSPGTGAYSPLPCLVPSYVPGRVGIQNARLLSEMMQKRGQF